MQQHGRYLDLTTDYGFKHVFGMELHKDILISFLNELFKGKKVITDLVYNKNEHVGDTLKLGSVIFDLTCTTDDGSQFIIEVQRSEQDKFKERTIYYASKLISDQAPKGKRHEWGYVITEVYVIAIMDNFHFSDTKDYLHDICLCNRQTGEIFYDRLGFIYIELPNFNKTSEQLTSVLEKWLFVLKNMVKLNKLPNFLDDPIFQKLFQIAEYSNLSKREKAMYDVSLKRKWDEYSLLTSATNRGIQQGLQQGLQQGRLETLKENAQNMLALGLDLEIISKSVGLSIDEIKKLCN
ncbi:MULTISPECIES: Rpn family recombination-promoting nuclease/putative transposase [unclassified Lonepinella]|uniref:Rpn family recombination-promoting nuclease/putative transposase n=1 Tax=unclassified Lonepinella TaxID=2642006 RepID=UPI0036D9AE58